MSQDVENIPKNINNPNSPKIFENFGGLMQAAHIRGVFLCQKIITMHHVAMSLLSNIERNKHSMRFFEQCICNGRDFSQLQNQQLVFGKVQELVSLIFLNTACWRWSFMAHLQWVFGKPLKTA
jgi:hypothetical protein